MGIKSKEHEIKDARKIEKLKSRVDELREVIRKGAAHLWTDIRNKYSKAVSLFKKK